MKLDAIRSSVVYGATGGRPTLDLGFPLSLIDYWILVGAVALSRNDALSRRTPFVPGDWMYTKFSCVAIAADSNNCTTCGGNYKDRFVATMPFTPVNMSPNGMAIADIGFEGGDVSISLQRYAGRMMSHGRGMKPTYKTPSAQIIGNKMYIHAPKRDLNKCKLFIFGIPEAVTDDDLADCDAIQDINVPIEGALLDALINDITQKVIAKRSQNMLDRKDDGAIKNAARE